jgi:hypothetical protein
MFSTQKMPPMYLPVLKQKPIDDQDQGKHEQYVNQFPSYFKGKSQQPKNEDNYDDCPKHDLSITHSGLSMPFLFVPSIRRCENLVIYKTRPAKD